MRSDRFCVWKRSSRLAGAGVALLVFAASPIALARKPQALHRDEASGGATTAFTGSIAAATGRFRGDHGRLRIHLSDGPPTTSVRPATIVLTALRCRERKGCLKLAGRLTGTLVGQPGKPDLPPSFAINAAGKVKPLGHVRSIGLVQGTGFIFRGREKLQLKLTASGGQITIDARSKPVPGFTTP
jgi:hypothetical protein